MLKMYSYETGAGTALTNTTSETVLGSVSFPANFFTDNKVILFKALVNATATNSTDTLQVRARFGPTTLTGTAIATSDTIDVADDDLCVIEGTIKVRDADASGTFISMASVNGPDAGGVDATEAHATITASIDFTAALLLEITGEWGAASTADSCRLEELLVFEIV